MSNTNTDLKDFQDDILLDFQEFFWTIIYSKYLYSSTVCE
jgi:hypothetical protein